MNAQGAVRRSSVATLQGFRDAGQRFAVLTAYDRATAELAEAAEIPAILVGDSLAQVALGHESTVRVGMSEMLHHVAAVVRSSRTALVIADMPFLSYVDVATAATNASAFLRDAGAGAVKLEGVQRWRRSCEHSWRAASPSWAYRLHPAVGAAARSRTRPGEGARRSGTASRRCARAAGGWRRGDRHRTGTRRTRRTHHPAAHHSNDRHRRRSGLLWPGAGRP